MIVVLQVLRAVIYTYLLLIFLRVLMTWMTGIDLGRAGELLQEVTDPYLNFFRTRLPVRIGPLDLSVLLASLALIFVAELAGQLLIRQTITVGIVLAIALSLIWVAVRFFLGLLVLASIVRGIGLVMAPESNHQAWGFLDQMLYNPSRRVVTRIMPKQDLQYGYNLAIFGGLAFAGWLGGSLLVSGLLVPMLAGLPF